MAEFATDIAEIGDQIAGLTLKQAVDLQGYLKDTYGIEAEGGGVILPARDNPIIIDKVEEQTTFDVHLIAAGEKKINVIKVVRAITSLGLKEAKDLVEGAPKLIKESVTKEEAEKLKAEIEKEGGKVEIK